MQEDKEVFRPKSARQKVTPEDLRQAYEEDGAEDESPLDRIQEMQQAIRNEVGDESPAPKLSKPDSPFSIGGNIPQAFRDVLAKKGVENPVKSKQKVVEKPTSSKGSDELESLLEQLTNFNQWEQIELPSKGKFYQGIPGVLHIRPMTGEEEQILATSRLVRKGKAIDMIFERCLKEQINTEELIAVDRTYLLIYLRGISYTPEYDVEIKCPECSMKFNTTIDLNSLEVDGCPVDFGPDQLVGVLPTSGFRFKYRLATGGDEQAINRYREIRIKEFGDQNEDDTLLHRTAMLLEYIEGVKDRNELAHLMKKLPINDVSHLRNTIAEPPFGVNTEIGIFCPTCNCEFEIDLPLEANFFFPRKKGERTHQ